VEDQLRIPVGRVVEIPERALVVLAGASGSGKSTFAARHFRPTEVVSSDTCRALVADDENNQAATNDAFELLDLIVEKRVRAGRLTVVDATNVKPDHRESYVVLARGHEAAPIALVFAVPERICLERNAMRPDRAVAPYVLRAQGRALRRSLRGLEREGFDVVHVFGSQEDVDSAVVRIRKAGAASRLPPRRT
jgi:protein phosphatase